MQQNRLLAGAGIAALLASLVALLPARVALGVLGLPAGTASGVSGTVWKGSVEHLSLEGIALGPVTWTARPLRLFTGQFAADIEAGLPEGFINGSIGLGLGGTIHVSNLEAAAPLALLAPGASDAGGQIAARFDRLSFTSGRVSAATGTLKIADMALPIPSGGRQLGPGTYEIAFDTPRLEPDEALLGQLHDAGGPLEIAGTVKFTPPRSYELTGTAKPRPDAPAELRDALRMLGPATPDGGHALSLAGSF